MAVRTGEPVARCSRVDQQVHTAAGPVISGSVPAEVYAATRETDWMTIDQSAIASRPQTLR